TRPPERWSRSRAPNSAPPSGRRRGRSSSPERPCRSSRRTRSSVSTIRPGPTPSSSPPRIWCASDDPVIRLSVNVNKVATVRNSRGGAVPSVLDAAEVVVAAGAGGVTVHPRADRRHITYDDVRALAERFRGRWGDALELNIEG